MLRHRKERRRRLRVIAQEVTRRPKIKPKKRVVGRDSVPKERGVRQLARRVTPTPPAYTEEAYDHLTVPLCTAISATTVPAMIVGPGL